MQLATRPRTHLRACSASLLLTACPGQSGQAPAIAVPAARATLSPLARVGELIFHDASLSASGRQACSSCHVADHAFAGADGSAVPLDGQGLDQTGLRNTPSIRYLAYTPAFSFDAAGTPTGGFNRDGRVATPALQALQQYEKEGGVEFAPFSSKYDHFLAGKVELDAQELRGLALFNDPTNWACAAPRARISPIATICAARSRCRACATSRSPLPTSTMAASAPRPRSSASTCAATLIRGVVPDCRQRHGAEIRRPAGAVGRRDRGRHRVPEHADRRLPAVNAVSPLDP